MEGKLIQQPGNYRLLSQLGRGGFADVYLGEHVYLKTQVAIKVLRVRPDDDTIADFLSKASAIARLKHPHIVDILEFDIKSGIPFLVMHYAPNGTLRQRHPKGMRVPFAKIMAYVKQAAAALQYAHNAKQIHGDVKPENMLLGNADEVLLSDFGLAPVAQQSFLQAKGRIAGTVTYMAPEQLQGKLCPASDQYALGIVVYEWLCGGQPFHGTFTEIATQHALVAPPPIRERCPDIPPEVEQVVLRALAKDQQKRFASIQHFALALEQALQQTPGPTMAGPASASTTPMAKRSLSRRSMLLGLTGLAALGGGFAWAALSGKLRIASTSTPRASIPAVVKDVLYTYHGHTNAVISLAWSPDGTRIASGGKDGTVQVWQAIATGKVAMGSRFMARNAMYNAKNQTSLPDPVMCIAWSTDNTRIAFGGWDQVYVWNSATGADENIFREYRELGGTVSWSPDGTRIAAGCSDLKGNAVVAMWDATTGNRITSIIHSSLNFVLVPPQALAWSPDNAAIAVGMIDHMVEVWKVIDGIKRINSYKGNVGGVTAVAWSPNGKYIASCAGDIVKYTSPTVSYHEDYPISFRYSSSTAVQVWDAYTGETIFSYHGHTAGVNALAWSPDGKRIASGSSDLTVQVWDAATGGNRLTYHGHTGPVNGVCWSPHGEFVASSSDDGTVRIWNASLV